MPEIVYRFFAKVRMGAIRKPKKQRKIKCNYNVLTQRKKSIIVDVRKDINSFRQEWWGGTKWQVI